MTTHGLEIDHVFLFIEPGGPEIDALQRLGFTETYRRAHPGQGTANVCFAFDNLYLELLWLTSEAEARSPATEVPAPSRDAAQRAALLAPSGGASVTPMHTRGGAALDDLRRWISADSQAASLIRAVAHPGQRETRK